MASLRDFRQTLARMLPFGFDVLTTTSTAPTASDLVVSGLLDAEMRSTPLTGFYVYGLDPPINGLQRRLREHGYDGVTGKLSVTAAWPSAVPTNIRFELLGRIPAIALPLLGLQGYREYLNDALRRLWFDDYLPIAGVANAIHYPFDLTTYPWLREANRLVGLRGVRSAGTDPYLVDSRGWDIFYDADVATVQVSSAYSAGESFDLHVKRPAHTLIKQGGTWTNQASLTAGLVNDSDEAVPSIEDVTIVARWLVYEDLAERAVSQPEREKYQMAAATAKGTAGALKFYKLEAESSEKPRLWYGDSLAAFR